MWERIRTALILLVIMGLCLFVTDNPAPMIALLSVGGVLAAHEWAKLIPNLSHSLWFVGSVLVLNFLTFVFPPSAMVVWFLALAIWLVAIWWVKAYPEKTTQWFNKPMLFYVGLVLVAATISAMFYLWEQSPWWLLYAMGLVWCADTGAYFAGRALGKRKLAPHVSPKKTYEGMIGGLLLCALVIFVVDRYLLDFIELQRIQFIVLSLLVAGVSVLGDLLESMAKRQAGVKDSGNLLPGHGGLLDRIDSMMATVPIFAIGYMYFFA